MEYRQHQEYQYRTTARLNEELRRYVEKNGDDVSAFVYKNWLGFKKGVRGQADNLEFKITTSSYNVDRDDLRIEVDAKIKTEADTEIDQERAQSLLKHLAGFTPKK